MSWLQFLSVCLHGAADCDQRAGRSCSLPITYNPETSTFCCQDSNGQQKTWPHLTCFGTSRKLKRWWNIETLSKRLRHKPTHTRCSPFCFVQRSAMSRRGTRATTSGDLQIPTFWLFLARSTFSYHAAQSWNGLRTTTSETMLCVLSHSMFPLSSVRISPPSYAAVLVRTWIKVWLHVQCEVHLSAVHPSDYLFRNIEHKSRSLIYILIRLTCVGPVRLPHLIPLNRTLLAEWFDIYMN